jgi:hypothetical protein
VDKLRGWLDSFETGEALRVTPKKPDQPYPFEVHDLTKNEFLDEEGGPDDVPETQPGHPPIQPTRTPNMQASIAPVPTQKEEPSTHVGSQQATEASRSRGTEAAPILAAASVAAVVSEPRMDETPAPSPESVQSQVAPNIQTDSKPVAQAEGSLVPFPPRAGDEVAGMPNQFADGTVASDPQGLQALARAKESGTQPYDETDEIMGYNFNDKKEAATKVPVLLPEDVVDIEEEKAQSVPGGAIVEWQKPEEPVGGDIEIGQPPQGGEENKPPEDKDKLDEEEQKRKKDAVITLCCTITLLIVLTLCVLAVLIWGTGTIDDPFNPDEDVFVGNLPTTPLDPYQPGINECDFAGQTQPHVISQCNCNGEVSTLSEDTIAKYNALVSEFVPTIFSDWTHTPQSCDAANQALIWVSTGSTSNETDLLQRFLLAYLYFSTSGSQWETQTYWLGEEDVCTWYGLFCGDGAIMKSIELDSNSLLGQVRNLFSCRAKARRSKEVEFTLAFLNRIACCRSRVKLAC